jgi:hypothetical protein
VPLLARFPGVPTWVVADRGYSSHAFREHVWSLGTAPAIRRRRDEAPVACPEPVCANRDRAEQLRARLKESRRREPGGDHRLAQTGACGDLI